MNLIVCDLKRDTSNGSSFNIQFEEPLDHIVATETLFNHYITNIGNRQSWRKPEDFNHTKEVDEEFDSTIINPGFLILKPIRNSDDPIIKEETKHHNYNLQENNLSYDWLKKFYNFLDSL